MKRNLKIAVNTLAISAIASLGLMSTTALAQAGADLSQKNGCMACHGVDKKILGPGFKDIAKKYKGNATAVATLTKKVKEGGSGTWGAIPMPPNGPKVNDADIKTMVEYILALN